MKTIRILLSASLIFSFAIANMSYAERHYSNSKQKSKGHSFSSRHHGKSYYNKRSNRYIAKKFKNRRYRNYRSYNPLGYFVTGAIVGSIINNNHKNHSYNNHSYNNHSHNINSSARISYWRDGYGDCYRIEDRGGEEIYLSVESHYCQ